ncbi:hypothetical protein Nepgr_002367 [Nepenthes gracilis]|uniref:Helicase ATP-binding domain-containing protein n=1 Tax=Nepenthes gracilis TaxID=150966 RepID=A0AAD3RY79_NEPGR|nr:hypothetical protein Nepgr_002367 [Nepenthes gracilis]
MHKVGTLFHENCLKKRFPSETKAGNKIHFDEFFANDEQVYQEEEWNLPQKFEASLMTYVSSQYWKAQLNVPLPDTCCKTEDVTATKGNEFEDYFLKRELLMEPKMGQEKQLPSAFLPWKKINQGHNAIQVFKLVQTRELALLTSQVCKELGKHLQIQVMATTGGTSLKDDIMWLYQPVHLLVGTPGRVLDLAKKGVCILKDCSMLIMDEADKLLSLEFQPLVEQLIHFLPKDHQILMFSATFPVTLKEFKDRLAFIDWSWLVEALKLWKINNNYRDADVCPPDSDGGRKG